jgi:hypothetical protein
MRTSGQEKVRIQQLLDWLSFIPGHLWRSKLNSWYPIRDAQRELRTDLANGSFLPEQNIRSGDWSSEPCSQGAVSMTLQDPGRQTMGKGSEKVRTNAKKNKLREKAKRLISEGKKLTGELVRYDPRHKKAT